MNGKQAIQEVAKRNGVSVREVRREIMFAIRTAAASTDPRSRAAFDAIPRKGDLPTPEEFIEYTAQQARLRMPGTKH